MVFVGLLATYMLWNFGHDAAGNLIGVLTLVCFIIQNLKTIKKILFT